MRLNISCATVNENINFGAMVNDFGNSPLKKLLIPSFFNISFQFAVILFKYDLPIMFVRFMIFCFGKCLKNVLYTGQCKTLTLC